MMAAAMLTSLAGCSSKTSNTSSGKKGEAFSPKLDTQMTETLEIAGFMGNFEALDQVMNEFNEIYPNVTFTYDHNTEFMLPDYLEANKNVDLFMTTDRNIKMEDTVDYFVQDYCLDLTDEGIALDTVRPEVVTDCTVDGKLLRVPVAMQTYGIVVNKTLLEKEKLSVPTNYQEFMDVMEALKEKGYTPLQGSDQHLYGDLMVNMAMNMIAQDADLEKALEEKSDEAVDKILPVFECLEEIMDKGYTDYDLNCTYPADNYDGSILAFFEGDMPFYVCNAECVSGMKKRESKSETFSANPFEYEFMYAPLGENGVYAYTEPWYGFSVNKDSEQKDLAVEFLRFLATKVDQMAATKGLPSVVTGSTDERYTSIQNPKNVQAQFCNDGSVPEHMREVMLDVCKGFGAGEYKDAKEAAAAFVEQKTTVQ